MTTEEAKRAFLEDKRINFYSRHGNFYGLKIYQLVYEKKDGNVQASFVLSDKNGRTLYSASLKECEIASA